MKVSIVIPTYNSERTLRHCLSSIESQDYSKEDVEILVVDGGSQDKTVDIARHYTPHILSNDLKTGEAGKAVGCHHARHEIIGFVDSDNILPDDQWLKRIVTPFQDTSIVAAEPLFYTYRASDHWITRYCALMGMNDPLCYFLGNYDRWCLMSQQWTGIPVMACDQGEYLKISFISALTPTIGANGFFIRKSAVESLGIGDYFADVDIIPQLIEKHGMSNVHVAKVKIGIVHIFCTSLREFIQKQRRRVCDYLYFSKIKNRKYHWERAPKWGIIQFVLSCILWVPLWIQAMKGFLRKKDLAWAFHPIACEITLMVYAYETLGAFLTQPTSFLAKKGVLRDERVHRLSSVTQKPRMKLNP